MNLSAVIITLNEERNIGRCLESIKDVVDEIIVVDSFSTDKTEEICLSYGAKVFKQQWLGFAGQKNFANRLASNEWILSIDADEALSEELKQSIIQLKKREPYRHEVFFVNRLTNYCGHWIHHSGWYPDRKPRLFHRWNSKWGGSAVHETLDFCGPYEDTLLEGDLLHYSYYTVDEHRERAKKYATLYAEEASKKGRRVALPMIWLKAGWRFFHDYFFRCAFLDGCDGYTICKIQASMTYQKYIILRELNKQSK